MYKRTLRDARVDSRDYTHCDSPSTVIAYTPKVPPTGTYAHDLRVNMYDYTPQEYDCPTKDAKYALGITRTIQYMGWMSLKNSDHSGTAKAVKEAIATRKAADALLASGSIVQIGTWSNGIAVGPGAGFTAATNEPAVITPVKAKKERALPFKVTTKVPRKLDLLPGDCCDMREHYRDYAPTFYGQGQTCVWAPDAMHGPAYVPPLGTPPGYILHDNRELDNAPAIWLAYQYMLSLHTSYAITDGDGNVIAPLGPVQTVTERKPMWHNGPNGELTLDPGFVAAVLADRAAHAEPAPTPKSAVDEMWELHKEMGRHAPDKDATKVMRYMTDKMSISERRAYAKECREAMAAPAPTAIYTPAVGDSVYRIHTCHTENGSRYFEVRKDGRMIAWFQSKASARRYVEDCKYPVAPSARTFNVRYNEGSQEVAPAPLMTAPEQYTEGANPWCSVSLSSPSPNGKANPAKSGPAHANSTATASRTSSRPAPAHDGITASTDSHGKQSTARYPTACASVTTATIDSATSQLISSSALVQTIPTTCTPRAETSQPTASKPTAHADTNTARKIPTGTHGRTAHAAATAANVAGSMPTKPIGVAPKAIYEPCVGETVFLVYLHENGTTTDRVIDVTRVMPDGKGFRGHDRRYGRTRNFYTAQLAVIRKWDGLEVFDSFGNVVIAAA